jgi:Kdo2-lipid IVA lauroyltransferase/acyltransferase
MKGAWKKFRYRLEWLGLTAAAWLVPRLPRLVCYHLAKIAGFLCAHLDRAGRAVALENLRLAFGATLAPSRRARIVTRSYQHFSWTMLDLLWSPRLTSKNFARWFEVEGLNEALAEIEPGQARIFATIHYGNFEGAARALGFSGQPVLIMAQQFKNPALDSIIMNLRRHPDHEITGRERGLIRMFKALKRGQNVGILSDLTLRAVQPSVVIECFGMKSCVTYAHAWLQEKTGAPIVPVHCEQLSGGRCRMIAQRPLEIPPGATETEIAQACWDRFEPLIRQNPAPWLWMYKQWRYRPTPADRPYPFYANDSEEFDRLLARCQAGRVGDKEG